MTNGNFEPLEQELIPSDYMPRTVGKILGSKLQPGDLPLTTDAEVEERQRIARVTDLSNEIEDAKFERDTYSAYAADYPDEPGFNRGVLDKVSDIVAARQELLDESN